MQLATAPMRQEAAAAGFCHSLGWNTRHPRIQILTVAELLAGAAIDYPSRHENVTFKRAPRAVQEHGDALQFPIGGEE